MRICSEENFNQLSDAITRIEKYIGTKNTTEETTLTFNINRLKESITKIVNQIFLYESTKKEVTHIISHNLDSYFLNVDIMSKNDDGTLENILCDVKYNNKNEIQINLCEEESLVVTIRKLD